MFHFLQPGRTSNHNAQAAFREAKYFLVNPFPKARQIIYFQLF